MQALTRDDVFAAFDPIDRQELVEPNLSGVIWEDLDCFAWKDPAATKAFMVVPLRERHVGLVFRLSTTVRSGFCDFCYGIDRESGAVSAMVSGWVKPRTSFGIMVCAGFDCSHGVRGLKYVYNMGETISAGRRIERLQENLAKFARRVKGLSGDQS